jgi:tetratricopeptide (TPR) repeat protein
VSGHLLSSTLAALVAVAAALLLRRQSAALRYAILLRALLRFAVPAAWLAQAGAMLARRLPAPPQAPRMFGDISRLLVQPDGAAVARAHLAFGFGHLLWLLWIAGTILCLARWIHRLAQRIPAVRDPDALEAPAFLAALERFPGVPSVELLIGPTGQGPAALGWFRPAIVLPNGLSAALSESELEAVIAHELAHVRRRDNLAAAAAHAIVSVFWFHPLLWWIERRMLAERERACDDLVLLHGARAEDYAAGLLKVCRMSFTGPAAYAGAATSDLGSRMEQIMSAETTRTSRPALRSAVAALLFAAAMVPAGAGFLRAQTPHSSNHLRAGDEQLRQQNYAGAMREYKLGIDSDPAQALVYRKRIIETLMRQGKTAEADAMARDILAANPGDVDTREFAAAQRIGKGDCARTVTELRGISAQAPQNIVAQLDLGRAQAACGDIAAARKSLEEVVRREPRFLRGWLELGKLQANDKEYDAALKSAAEVLKIDPSNQAAKLTQAAALTGKKQYDDARAVLQELLRVEPNSADAVFQMGTIYLAERNYAQAEQFFAQVQQMEPGNSRGSSGIVESYLAQKREDAAIALMQAEAARRPADPESSMALGNVAVRAGKYDLAISAFERALELTDKNAAAAGELYLRIGETCRRKGDLPAAIAALEKAHALQPENAMTTNTLALTLDAAGRKDEARLAYEAVLQLNPRSGVALNNLAYLLSENGGDLDQALVYVKRALELMPSLYEVRDTTGWVYLKRGQLDDAIAIFTELTRQEPSHSTWHYHLALALVARGDRDEARRELDAARQNNPPAAEVAKIQELLSSL